MFNANSFNPNSLPPHNNKMVWAVLCTVFCCLLGGILAIVYSSKSNNLYNNALFTNDLSMQNTLYYQSEQANKTAQTWITVSIITGILGFTGGAMVWITNNMATVSSFMNMID